MASPKTRTSRQTRTVLTFLLFAAIVAAAGLYSARLAWTGGNLLAGGGAVLLLLLAGFLALGTGVRSGPCPKCRKVNVEVRAGQYRACEGCGEYLAGDGRSLWLADPKTVADKPTFGALLPPRVVWPEGCVVCQAPPARTVPVSITVSQTGKNLALSAAMLAAGKVTVRTGGEKVYSIDVPHCARHNDGAALEKPIMGGLRILFRSYPYSRTFRERNNAPLR